MMPRSQVPGSSRLESMLDFWWLARDAGFKPTFTIAAKQFPGHYLVTFGQVVFTVALER